jgi:thiosulfate dehydrogenase (quinone) large subunit
MMPVLTTITTAQQVALVLLRTLIGWHFLYEGYFKLMRPAWSRDGEPLAVWSAAGYLKGATGPFAGLFQALGDAAWIGALDTAVAMGLVAAGLSLMLGLFTRAGCALALLMLLMFYLAAIPTTGLPDPRAEGVYLLVNKNLIEAAAVVVLLLFPTGLYAGVDRWLHARRLERPRTHEVQV